MWGNIINRVREIIGFLCEKYHKAAGAAGNYRNVLRILFAVSGSVIVITGIFLLNDYHLRNIGRELKVFSECGSGTDYSTYGIISASTGLEKNDDIIFRAGEKNSNRLAITCNVDWGEEMIPEMLEILRDRNVHITFFVSGKWAERNPDLLRVMYMYGHEIQNHGYSHKLCSQVSDKDVESEIDKTEKVIYNLTGHTTDIFAPPSGDFDERTVNICRKRGYLLSLWSADTIDWKEGSYADVIVKRIMQKELHGAVILMHPKKETVKALPILLDEFNRQKIYAGTVSELMNRKIRNNE